MTQAFLNTPILSKSTTNSITKRFLTTNIFIVGKKNGGEEFIYKGYEMYEKRLTPVMKINTIFLKSDEALVEAIRATKGAVIALDENGSQYSSRDFSNVVYKGLGIKFKIFV
jgi:23S rRNA pseudoU1915 N3-methylase RlmH